MKIEFKVGDKVWITMKSFGVNTEVYGEVLAVTPKRIKCLNGVRNTVGYYAPQMIRPQ